MSFVPADFADDTDLERLTIARLGAARPKADGHIYDLRGQKRGDPLTIGRTLTASVGFEARDELRQSLQPLAFGASYKIVDMLVEHVLRSNRASGRLSFAQKTRALGARPANLPVPFALHSDLWDRLAKLYLAFQDARHALTHRRAGTSTSGELRVHDDGGRQTDVIASLEIASFAAVALGTSDLVIASSEDPRQRGEIASYLNQLQARHGLSLLAGASLGEDLRLLKAMLRHLGESRWQVDVAHLRKVIGRQPPSAIWDLELYADGNRMFVARWEDVPGRDQVEFLEFDESLLPDWLTEEVPRP
ncbi:MAG: hypothetical protein JO372_21395 [Solirubrobacterales bacterium]|nr:hypothetical protein [Solirubrobacterales bacterium]